MIKSMTGFGRGEASTGDIQITAELKSVNHRFRDIYVRLSSRLPQIEMCAKKEIEQLVSRGKVDAFINIERDKAEQHLEPDLALAESYYTAINQIKEKLNVGGHICISDIIGFKDVIKGKELTEEEDILQDGIMQALRSALESLDEMRINEGEALSLDIKSRLSLITKTTNTIKDKQPEIKKLYMDKITERITTLTKDEELDKDRFTQEIVLMAEKSDITEELVRLASHTNQFLEILKKEGAIGRKLDFLVQEMNREANTIASKSCDASISKEAVEIKTEIEKIREQIQNIE